MTPRRPEVSAPGSVAAWRTARELEGLAPDLGWAEATGLVDGLVDGSGAVADSAGQVFRQMQTGKVQQYAAIFFAAAVVLAGLFIVVI